MDPHAVISYTGVGKADLAVDTLKSMMGVEFYHGVSDIAVGNFNDDEFLDIAVASKWSNKAHFDPDGLTPNYDILSGGYGLGAAAGTGGMCDLIPTQWDSPRGFVASGGPRSIPIQQLWRPPNSTTTILMT